MRQTLEELMRSQNSTRWPERWNEVYESVMDDFEANGCVLLDPEYYVELNKKYGILKDYLEYYKLAATEVAKDEGLSRVLALICDTMKHRETAMAEAGALSLPHNTDGTYEIKYEMLTALAMTYMADYTYGLLTSRDLPEHQINYAMNVFDGMIKTYQARNEGRVGAMSWSWYQLGVDAKLFDMGKMQLEIGRRFKSKCIVFRNADGKIKILANKIVLHRDGYALGAAGFKDEEGSWEPVIEETDDAYIGYPYDERGWVMKEKITLKKSEWKKFLEPGDYALALHIPPVPGMTHELVTRSLLDSIEFVKTYYPEVDYKAFYCGSWLLDPQLVDLLGEEANISKFCKRFYPMTIKSEGKGVFSFVYLLKDVNNVVLCDLPENTRLERTMKKHYLDGGFIYEVEGIIPFSEV